MRSMWATVGFVAYLAGFVVVMVWVVRANSLWYSMLVKRGDAPALPSLRGADDPADEWRNPLVILRTAWRLLPRLRRQEADENVDGLRLRTWRRFLVATTYLPLGLLLVPLTTYMSAQAVSVSWKAMGIASLPIVLIGTTVLLWSVVQIAQRAISFSEEGVLPRGALFVSLARLGLLLVLLAAVTRFFA